MAASYHFGLVDALKALPKCDTGFSLANANAKLQAQAKNSGVKVEKLRDNSPVRISHNLVSISFVKLLNYILILPLIELSLETRFFGCQS